MSKRFTDTGKWDKVWIRRLSCEHKLFWCYILDKCDHAGVWEGDLELASFQLGISLDPGKLIAAFDGKLELLPDGKWYISSFVDYQYGPLNPANRVHASVIAILKKHHIDPGKPLSSPLQGAKDKDKDKDKAKDKDKEIGVKRKLGKPTWMTPFNEVYEPIFESEIPWGKVSVPLKAVVDRVGEAKAVEAFQRYCFSLEAEGKLTMFSAAHFKNNLAQWRKQGRRRELDPQHTDQF